MDLAPLLELQRLDTSIDQARHARRVLPAMVAHDAAVAALDAARAEAEIRRRRQFECQSELDAIERESGELDAQRARLDKQMKTIIAPREAEALQHEIQLLVDRRDALDDRGLELLEESASLDGEIADLAGRVASAEATVGECATARRRAEEEADLQLADLASQREVLAATVGPDRLADYENRRRQFGGVAVVIIERGSCTGCHMEVSVSELDAMKRLPPDEAAECPNCARLVVR